MRQKELRKKRKSKSKSAYKEALAELKLIAEMISAGNALYNETKDLKVLNKLHKLRIKLQEKERELHKEDLQDDIQESGRSNPRTIRTGWKERSYYSQGET